MKEKVTFRSFFSTVKSGAVQIYQWVLGALGLKEGNRYSKLLRTIVGTCVTIWLVSITFALFYSFFEDQIEIAIARYRNPIEFPWSSEKVLSSGVVFVDPYGSKVKCFIYNHNTGKTILKNVDWVVKSDFGDTLAVFSRHGKRGYINTRTGEVAIPAVYEKAWLFSEDLAAVQKGGRLIFIDRKGNEVLKGDWSANTLYDLDPIFRDGYCLLDGYETGEMGVIDKSGNWMIAPEYAYIAYREGLWVLSERSNEHSILDSSFQPLIPGKYADISFRDECIIVQPEGAPSRAYDMEGRLINDCVIDRTHRMGYKAGEESSVDSDGCLYTRDIIKMTDRLRYRVSFGDFDYRYGLMDLNGHRITEPVYSEITAIAADLYLCSPHGIIINGKGQLVK